MPDAGVVEVAQRSGNIQPGNEQLAQLQTPSILRLSLSGTLAFAKLNSKLWFTTFPPTSAITDYAIAVDKLSANGHFFLGAQIAVSL